MEVINKRPIDYQKEFFSFIKEKTLEGELNGRRKSVRYVAG